MQQRAISKLDLKRINRSEILRILCAYGPTSRVDLAKRLRLTRAAITIITAEMIEQGIVCERGDNTSEHVGRGRKKVLLDLCDNQYFTFGAVIDHRHLSMGLTTLKGQTLDHRRLPIQGLSLEEVLQLLFDHVKEVMQLNCLNNNAILGIGVCLSRTALHLFPKQNEDAALSTLRRMMDIRFSIPTIVSTTTASLGIAEHYLFAEPNKPESVLLVRYDYDLEAAIVLSGKLYQEGKRPSNWFAHIVVDPHGDYCTCGKIGCGGTKMLLEEMKFKIKDAYREGLLPILYEESQGHWEQVPLTMDHLDELLREEFIAKLFSDAFQYLHASLDTVTTVLNPDKIIMFGMVIETIADHEAVLSFLSNDKNDPLRSRLMRAHISENQIYLAGCGQCIKHFFVDQGGQAR